MCVSERVPSTQEHCERKVKCCHLSALGWAVPSQVRMVIQKVQGQLQRGGSLPPPGCACSSHSSC